MLIVLAVLLVCAFMGAIYAIVGAEERHLLKRQKQSNYAAEHLGAFRDVPGRLGSRQ